MQGKNASSAVLDIRARTARAIGVKLTIAATVTAATFVACATPAHPPKTSAAPPAATATPTPAASPAAKAATGTATAKPGVYWERTAPASPTPPDGKWLTDGEGRRYFLTEVPKVEGHYLREGEHQIRVDHGLLFDVAEERPSTFVIKIYEAEVADDSQVKARQAERAEAAKRAEAEYVFDAKTSDRLRWMPFEDGLPKRGQWRDGFAVADINGDGHPDIVFGPPRKVPGQPVIFLGDGQGHWHRWSEAHFEGQPLDYGDVAVADFDGDGHLDAAFTSHLRGIQVFVQRDGGRFALWSEGIPYRIATAESGPVKFSSRAITTVDWNGDGRIDLAALGEGPRLVRNPAEAKINPPDASRGVTIYLNQGNGKWEVREPKVDVHGIFGEKLAVGDVNGDGMSDILAANSVTGNTKVLYLGRADGSWDVQAVDALRPGTTQSVALADLDGDGHLDVVLGYTAAEGGARRGGVDVLLQQRDGSWRRRPVVNWPGENGVASLATGDLDGDGKLDLVALDNAANVLVFLGDGKGGFSRDQSPTTLPSNAGCSGSEVKLADLDGDGRPELVAGFAGEPGSEVTYGGKPACMSQGSLDVWKLATRP